MSSNLLRRVAVALVGIPAAVVLVAWGGWALAAALGVLAGVGAWEFFRLGHLSGSRPLAGWGVLAAVVWPLAVFAALDRTIAVSAVLGGATVWLLIVAGVSLGARSPAQHPIAAVSATITGVLYTSGLLSFGLVLRHGTPALGPAAGTALVFFPLVIIWVGDALAMAAGSTVGGKPLAPVISPRKTWAGALAHAGSAVIVAPSYGLWILARHGIAVELWGWIALGLAVSVAGQLGDLVESLFKRDAGVKDSGRFFSGHGGVLDRLDALYWALPTAVLALSLYGVL